MAVECNANHKGNAAELAIAFEAARRGLSVFKPLTEHERYDLVLGIGGELFRVQCKWASQVGDVIQVRLRTSYHSPTKGYVVKTYGADEVDLVAVYCGDCDRCYLLPASLFVGRNTAYLRLEETRNNQRAALNWAADYEFSGAVAQLEEHSNGIREATGSNPVSSTPTFDLKGRVGMDEFYARLAHYVRHAEAGGNVVVTRWGRPVAALGPVPGTLKPPRATADE